MIPRSLTASMIAEAQRIPRAGPSKVEEPVAGRIELTSTMACQLPSHERVMGFEERPPSRIAKLGEVHCRVHDVGEEDGHEDAILLGGRRLGVPVGGQELLDVVSDEIDLRQRWDVAIFPSSTCARNPAGQRRLP